MELYLPYQQALEIIFFQNFSHPTETVYLPQAYGRVLAEEVRADRNSPSVPLSAMDGYDLNSSLTPGSFRVIGEVPAGSLPSLSPGEGEAVKVFTGSVVPRGCDAVVPVEEVKGEEGRIEIIVLAWEEKRITGNYDHTKKLFSKIYSKPLFRVIAEKTEKYRYNPKHKIGGTFGEDYYAEGDKPPVLNWQMPYIPRKEREKLFQVIKKDCLEIFNREAIEKKSWIPAENPVSPPVKRSGTASN